MTNSSPLEFAIWIFAPATKTTRSYRETLQAYFDAPDFAGHRYLDFLWLAGGKQAGDITLGEVRGKIVLFEDSWE